MSIRMPKAKGGKDQSADVTDPDVMRLIRALVHITPRGSPLFPGGITPYRSLFNRMCRELGLSDAYGTHSLRHGGATRLYLRGESVERILIRGRWKSTPSARIYPIIKR